MAHSLPPARKYACGYLILAVLFWLWPFFAAGWKGRTHSFLPRGVVFQYSAAGFFTKRAERWWDHHLELRLVDRSWTELDKRKVFPMGVFGYRTRLDRILNESHRSPLSGRIQARIADHIARNLHAGDVEGLNPGEVEAIRLVRSVWPVGGPGMAKPEGRWNPPPSTTLPRERHVVLGTWRFTAGRAVPVGRPRSEPHPAGGSPTRRRIVRPPTADTEAPGPDGADSPPRNP